MPYDAGYAAAVIAELSLLAGGRIEKIIQPLRDKIIMTVYGRGEHYRLALDADMGNPRVYITAASAEGLPTVSNFCGLLRKYVQNARIIGVNQVGFDRVMEFCLEGFDEMGFARTLYLYVECIRKQANIILAGAEKKIISAMKTVDLSMSESRQILPGLLYTAPDGFGKKNPLTSLDRDELAAELAKTPDAALESRILALYSGMSPLVTREIAYLAAKDTAVTCADADFEKVWFHLYALTEKIRARAFTNMILTDTQGKMLDFSYIPIRQYESGAVTSECRSPSELLESFYGKKDSDNSIKQKSQDILKTLTNASSRLTKKIKTAEQDLAECAAKEKNREFGDLVTANIYRIKKGESKLEAENFYADGASVTIPLDINLTPPQNAQRYYKKYNKQKTAEYHLSLQIESAKADLDYVESVFESLTKALSERELAEIRDELRESGFVRGGKGDAEKRHGKKPPKKLPVSKPAEYTTKNGFKVLCGRNNRQNDSITFTAADKNDIWFHAQKIPGSHTILLCTNPPRQPSNDDLLEAAAIAAKNSKAKNLPLVPIDYTFARYVKKPGGAKPGFVTYTNFKTITVHQ